MGSEAISLIGIFVGLFLLIYLAYKNVSVLFLAPIAAIVVAILSGVNPITALTDTYMTKFVTFAKNYFLILFFGAIFGKLMGECGAAKAIAFKISKIVKKFPNQQEFLAVLSLVIVCSVLTLGGISSFVVVFTLVAIAKDLFKELDIPWHMYTCSVMGSGLYTMTMIPGTPAIQNIIPTTYLGTTPMAAPALGITATVISIIFGVFYIKWMVRLNKKRGEGFLPSGTEITKVTMVELDDPDIPLLKCLIPSIVLLIVLNVLNQHASLALLCAIVTTVIVFYDKFTIQSFKKALADGGSNATNAVMNACSVVGFGGVVASVAGYQLVIKGLGHIPGPPIVQLIVAVNVAAGITGSASGGLGIAFDSLLDRFLASGYSPEIIHRMAAMSSGGLDTMPHCSTVVNTLAVTRLSYKEGYKHYFAMTVAIPIITTIICGALVAVGIFS